MVFADQKVNMTTEFCIFKLEENNHIFLAGGDALVDLAEPMHNQFMVMTDAKICW